MNFQPIPIAFPNAGQPKEGLVILAADIGGTKTQVSMFEAKKDKFYLIREKKYVSSSWGSFYDIITDFRIVQSLGRISIAVAGPVADGVAKMTNLNWEIDAEVLAHKLGVKDVYILNDLEANAYGLAALEEKDLKVVYPGKGMKRKNAALISPGTGLGEAGLYFNGKAYQPFATEGGHTDFGPRSEFEISLYRFLRKKHEHVSWERLVSGPGIYTIYHFLRDVMGWKEPDWLREEIKTSDPAEAISKGAEKGCKICRRTMDLFVTYLAEESANLALQFNATGGIYIGGGIIPKIWNKHYEEVFLDAFFEVGRLKHMVENVPVSIILNSNATLLGALYYGAFGNANKIISS